MFSRNSKEKMSYQQCSAMGLDMLSGPLFP